MERLRQTEDIALIGRLALRRCGIGTNVPTMVASLLRPRDVEVVVYVVFDTNIWKKHGYMRSPAAAAIRLYMNRFDAKIGIPEVVKLEIEGHIRQDINECCKEIQSNYDKLLQIFGKLKQIVLPTGQEIESIVQDACRFVGLEYEHVAFDAEDARKSFIRTIEKIPPSHKGQQFKDGVLWENCKKLLMKGDVAFVTEDKAFYEAEKYGGGLARILMEEILAVRTEHEFKIYPNIEGLLEAIKSPIEVPTAELVSCMEREFRKYIDPFLENAGFAMDGEWHVDRDIFATEVTDILFVRFRGSIDCVDVGGQGRYDADLTAEGEVKFDHTDGKFSEMQIGNLAIGFTDADGRIGNMENVFASMSFSTGHPIVLHTVRKKLD